MAQYGTAVTWVVIMFTIFITGLIYMMLTPLIETFVQIGMDSGADPLVVNVINDAITIWMPMVIVFSLIAYGWRKSRNRIE
jgi:hypothetical protein